MIQISVKTLAIRLSFVLMSLMLLPAHAQTKYVTDRIVLELHETKSSLSPLIEQLPSGAALNVLEKDGAHARVETADGKSGWVEAAYLQNSKPAQLLLEELKIAHEQLKNEHQQNLNKLENMESIPQQPKLSDKTLEDAKNVGWMRGEMNKARQKTKQLEQQLKSISGTKNNAKTEKADLQNRISELELILKASNIENEENTIEINRLISEAESKAFLKTAGMETQVSLLWYLISILIFLGIGAFLGMRFLDAQNRKRHGGFKI